MDQSLINVGYNEDFMDNVDVRKRSKLIECNSKKKKKIVYNHNKI